MFRATQHLDAAGHRLSVSELSGRTVNYGYDNLYRLTGETIASDPNSINGTVNYIYDPVGNRKQITSTLAPVPAGLWNYDANDRFTAGDTYDADGNTVSSGGIANVYDFENHLIQKGGATIVYDGDGNRVSKTVAGVTTTYLVDTLNPTGYAQVVNEAFSGNSSSNRELSHSYVYGLELISQTRNYTVNSNSTTQKIYYAYDGHGSVRALTDPTGAVTDTYDYDAFGNLLHSTGTTPNNYLFTGEQFDPDLGLYYNRARYLNVSTGRFWMMDAFEGRLWDPFSLYRYAYTSENPVDFSDPTGFDEIGDILVGETEKELIQIRITVQIIEEAPQAISLARQAFQVLSEITVLASAILEGDNEPNPGPSPPKNKNSSEVFYRFGFAYEDAASLEQQSQSALPVVGFHGVSVMTRAKYPAPFATRAEIEVKFRLEKTTTNPFHYTVVLPTPVTDSDALAFNTIFKRKIPKGLFQ